MMTIVFAAILLACGIFTLGRRFEGETAPLFPMVVIGLAIGIIAVELKSASVDRSGEAGETALAGSTEGESAARSEAKGDAQ